MPTGPRARGSLIENRNPKLGSWAFVSAELPVFSGQIRQFSAIIRQSRIHEIVYILVNIWIFFIIENCYIFYDMRSLQNCNKKDDYVIYHKKSHRCSWDFHITGTIFSPNCRITAESRILTAEHQNPIQNPAGSSSAAAHYHNQQEAKAEQ